MEEMIVVMKEVRDLLKSIDEKLDGVKEEVKDVSSGIDSITADGRCNLLDILNKLWDIQLRI